MLHILWMIGKFILIVLGIVLGLLLLAVLLVLFCPVRYRGGVKKLREAEIKETEGWGQVSWLFHGLSLRFCFRNGNMEMGVRLFGIPVDKLMKKRKAAKTQPQDNKKTAGAAEAEMPENEQELSEDKLELPDDIGDFPDAVPEISGTAQEDTDDMLGTDDPQEVSAFSEESSSGGLFHTIMEKIRNIIRRAAGIVRNIFAFPGRVISRIRKIRLTLCSIHDRIEWYKEFISHPRTKEALNLVWKDIKGLIKHVLPTKIKGNIIFGSEDPSVTGTVLAFLGMSVPLHRNCIAVTPLFDGENVLEGDIWLKGRIYGCFLLKTAAEIYLNKNVKYVIGRWKRKEG